MMFGEKFFHAYLKAVTAPTIVDIGSYDVNGTLRTVAPENSHYIGLDLEQGPGVDLVLKDPYTFPLDDNVADAVVSSSCFEHTEFFWISFLEMLRITKPSGVIYIQAPSNGVYHRHPIDCWRFYPDSGRALEHWANRNNYSTKLLESFIGAKKNDIWNDFVMIFCKDQSYVSNYSSKITDQYNEFTNAYHYNVDNLINFNNKNSPR